MVNQTDTIENGSFNGNLTILNSGNADLGPGNLEVQGTVYTNTISANTTSGSITLTDPSLFTNSTASTSAITGALIVTGGIGITGNSYFAGVNTYTNTTVIPSANGTNTASGSINIAGGLALTGSANYSNVIIFNAINNAEPNALGGTRSIGSKIVLWPNNGPAGTSSDYSIGIGTNSMWYQVDTGSIFNWYSGATLIGAMNVNGMTIYGANALPTTSSTPSGALNIAGSLALYNTSGLSACIMLQGGQYGPPNTTSRTIGTRIVLNPTAFPTSSTDYAIGITTSPGVGVWFGVNQISDHFYFYNNSTITLDITNASTTFGSNNIVSITNGTTIPLNDIAFTGVEGALNVAGDIVLSNATRQTIGFASGGVGAPSFTNRTLGTKIILKPTVNATQTDSAIGVNTSSVWISNGINTGTIDFYLANTLEMSLSNTTLSLPSNTTSSSTATGALVVTGGIGVSGNITTATLSSTGLVTLASLTITGATIHNGTETFNGTVTISGTNTFTMNTGLFTTAGLVTITNATASTTVSSGALIVTGGIGVGGNLNIGGNFVTPKSTGSGALTFTFNGMSGSVTTTSLALTQGSSQAVTFANTSITTTSVIQCSLSYSGTGIPVVMITAQSSGNCTFTIKNAGTVVLNAVVKINFLIT